MIAATGTGSASGDPGARTVLGHLVPPSVQDPRVEADAVRGGAALVPAPWERLLEVRGPDAASFLHSMLTQHIRALAVGDSVPAALATRKGHLVADLAVCRAAESLFQLRMPSFVSAEVQDVLEKHQVTEDVSFTWIHDEPDAFLLVGPRAAPVLETLRPHLPSLRAVVLPVRELTPSDTLLAFERPQREAILARCILAGAVHVGWNAFDRRRIERGRAWFGLDADGERLVPEPGFDDRIHYDKGCYLGQEPLARLHFRGRPNWALVRLAGPWSPGIVPGSDLVDGEGERVGWVTSVAGGDRSAGLEGPERSADSPLLSGSPYGGGQLVALGYLHRRFRDTGAPTVRVGTAAGLSWVQV